MWVEAVAFVRSIGSFDAIAVELTWRNAADPNMPDVTGPMSHRIQINDPGRNRVLRILIELQANTGRVTAEQNEISSVSVLMCTPRQWVSRLNFTVLRRSRQAVRLILL
jgi:hypothetical protein